MSNGDNPNTADLEKEIYQTELVINLYSTVIVFLAVLYILRRLFKSTTPSINFIKGKLQTLGAWILQFSVFFYLLFNVLITYLSQKLGLRRIEIELSKYVAVSDIKSIKNYNLDLSELMVFSLKFYEILLGTSLFILISTLIPKEIKTNYYEIYDENNNKIKNKTSLRTFSLLWAILRIPILLYLDTFRKIYEIQIFVFVSEVFLAIEFVTIGIFFLIIKSKYKMKSLETPTEKINLMFFTCFVFGIFKHIVNLIDLPFQLAEIHFHVLGALQFALQLGLFLLTSSIYFPYKTINVVKITKYNSADKIIDFNNDIDFNNERFNNQVHVVDIEPYIEFDE